MKKMSMAKAAKSRGIDRERAELFHRLRGLTPQVIEALPQGQLRSLARRLDYPDMPRARLAWRASQARGNDGRIPREPLLAALLELDSIRARDARTLVAGVPAGGRVDVGALTKLPIAGPIVLPVAGLETRAWRPLGPRNVGGRTRSIIIDPADPQVIWAGSIAGGIWRSDDGGASWTPVDDFMANLAVTTMIMSPVDSAHIYAGTGEGFGNGDANRGAGIFETRDGRTWRRLQATNAAGFHEINRLALSADGSTLRAVTPRGLHRSADPARATWTTVVSGRIADVKFHPSDPLRAVAGAQDAGRSWFTTDGGQTWTESKHSALWSGRVELCFAAADPQVVYASELNANGTIWRSGDGGKTFVKRKTRNTFGQTAAYLGDQGWYGNVIWAGDPTTSDLVVVGGIDLWRSTDGGDTLVDISSWWDDRSAHADHHAIVADPGYDGVNNRRVWFGNDGGIYRTNDLLAVGNDAKPPRVAGWESRNDGYAVTQFFAAAANTTSRVIVGGTQDNGTLAYDIDAGDMTWRRIFGGDGGFCCADQGDPQHFYGQYVFLGLHRSTDGASSDDRAGDRYICGQFWNGATGTWEWKPEPFRIPDAFNQRALFIAPFAIDPNNSARLPAGGESLWRTNVAKAPNTPTSGPRWARIKPPAGGMISAIAIAPASSDRIWVGHESGQVWRSGNATASDPTWQRIDGLGSKPLRPTRMCTQLLVSTHSPDRILSAYGGFERENLWLSDDNGETWRVVSTGLPAVPIRAVAIHPDPARAGWFYAGTEVGLFASEDLGSSWSPTNEGPANVSVDDLIWMGTELVCVTHGRGVFAIDLT